MKGTHCRSSRLGSALNVCPIPPPSEVTRPFLSTRIEKTCQTFTDRVSDGTSAHLSGDCSEHRTRPDCQVLSDRQALLGKCVRYAKDRPVINSGLWQYSHRCCARSTTPSRNAEGIYAIPYHTPEAWRSLVRAPRCLRSNRAFRFAKSQQIFLLNKLCRFLFLDLNEIPLALGSEQVLQSADAHWRDWWFGRRRTARHSIAH